MNTITERFAEYKLSASSRETPKHTITNCLVALGDKLESKTQTRHAVSSHVIAKLILKIATILLLFRYIVQNVVSVPNQSVLLLFWVLG